MKIPCSSSDDSPQGVLNKGNTNLIHEEYIEDPIYADMTES